MSDQYFAAVNTTARPRCRARTSALRCCVGGIRAWDRGSAADPPAVTPFCLSEA
jgi:hypothetical protein